MKFKKLISIRFYETLKRGMLTYIYFILSSRRYDIFNRCTLADKQKELHKIKKKLIKFVKSNFD